MQATPPKTPKRAASDLTETCFRGLGCEIPTHNDNFKTWRIWVDAQRKVRYKRMIH